MKTDFVIGVDIGGSHITAGLVNITQRTVLKDSIIRHYVDPHASAAAIIDDWTKAIQQVAAFFEGQAFRIGIAMPGPFDYVNGISLIRGFNKYESLYGLNVKEMLAQKLSIPVTGISLKNDAAAFLQGEIFCGAATGYAKAIGITLGTGLGSARKVDNDTEACAVNVSPLHEGRAEDYISIRWFLSRYAELSGQTPPHVKYIANKVKEDPYAAQVFNEFVVNLAFVLQRFIEEEQPNVLVLGGGIANAFDIFYPALEQQLKSRIGNTAIRQSLLGESAAMAGAAGSWENINNPQSVNTIYEQ
jgi:glucokinase